MSIGFLELLIVAPIALIRLAIPTGTFVMAVLIYRKLSHIERELARDGS